MTGATGFIGRHLTYSLIEDGYNVTVFTRNPDKALKLLGDKVCCVFWDPEHCKNINVSINGDYIIINLAGENISSGRWTKNKKRRIMESRLNAGKFAVNLAETLKKKPHLIIQASAAGYYGNSGSETVTEGSQAGSGFLSEVVQKWEVSIKSPVLSGTRKIFMRTGLVLGKDGGVLKKMIVPFKFFAGGHIGEGSQWYSWIHISDIINAIKFFIKNESTEGIYNLTSPNPVTAKELSIVLGKALNRPSWFHVPEIFLKTIFGQMADEVLLSGQKVIPERLVNSGFEFKYPELEPALREILL